MFQVHLQRWRSFFLDQSFSVSLYLKYWTSFLALFSLDQHDLLRHPRLRQVPKTENDSDFITTPNQQRYPQIQSKEENHLLDGTSFTTTRITY